jgi:hypothetical protein
VDGPAHERVQQGVDDGALATFADAYRVELSGRGYTPLSTGTELRQAARFSGLCVLESDLWLLDL